MEAASASAFPSVSRAFFVAVELMEATSLSFWPLIFAASPRPSERNRAAIWCRSLDIRSIIFSATAGLYLLRLNRSSSSSIPKSEIFWRVRSVICFSISPRPSWISGIVLGHSSPRFAAQNVIQSRQGTALVVEPIVVEEWVANTPPGETIDNNVELVFGRALGRWPVPGEDTFVESVHLIDDRELNLQSRVCDRANDFT